MKIAYGMVTVLCCAFFAATGFMELTHTPHIVQAMISMGYPEYSLRSDGLARLLAVLALLVPALSSLREWAYAYLTFAALGFTLAHFANHRPPEVAIAVLVFTQASYWLWRKLRATTLNATTRLS